jgi:hypothetical protein
MIVESAIKPMAVTVSCELNPRGDVFNNFTGRVGEPRQI